MKDDSVRSIERAFFILKCFNLDTPRLTLTQIAEQINLPTTTTLRILATLVAVGLLAKTDGRYYKLGRESFLIGAIARAHFRPQHVAYPYMVEIRDDTNEATSLYGIDGECRVCYEHVPSLLSMRCVVRVGDCFPLWAGAGGKVLLAYESNEVIEREITKAKKITDTTIIDKELFLEELKKIRGMDYAISYGEREDGIISLAVPIFDMQGRAPLCLSIAGPAARFTEETATDIVPRLQSICTEISRKIFV